MSRIPPEATRVFNGEIFEVYQWPQPLFDGTTATFEALRRDSTAFILAMQGEDVIFTRQEQPRKGCFRSPLGGRVEKGEAPLEGAKRELLEEAGMVSDDWALIRQYSQPGKIEHDVYLFVARDCRVVAPQKLDAGERITLERAPLDVFIRDVLGAEDFLFRELRAEVFSAYSPSAASRFKAAVLEPS